jgi:hypothetical protein
LLGSPSIAKSVHGEQVEHMGILPWTTEGIEAATMQCATTVEGTVWTTIIWCGRGRVPARRPVRDTAGYIWTRV